MMGTRSIVRASLLALLLFGLSVAVWSEESASTWEKVIFHVDEMANARWALLLANAYFAT